MIRYYDRQGNPIDKMEWVKGIEDDEAKRVAVDEREGIQVSTVWLGLDHQWGHGPPLIFETMIFGGEHDLDQWRYSTEEEAIAGHAAAVELAFEGPR